MERRDPSEPGYTAEQMRDLVTRLGAGKAADLERQERNRLQAESDAVVNFMIAVEIAESIRTRKAPYDHTWLLREVAAIRQSDAETSAVAMRTSGILRVLTRDPGTWDAGLSAYLYATQYLFVIESTVTLALDKTLFFFKAIQSTDSDLEWPQFRNDQLQMSLHGKLQGLEQLGVHYFGTAINRELRNNMAHAHFEVDKERGLLVGRRGARQRLFTLDDLCAEMDKTVDLLHVAAFVANEVLTRPFLEHLEQPG